MDRLGSGRAHLARFLAGRKPRKQARGAAERSLNGFVADQACAVGAILQHELPGVKCLELRAVSDADYCGCGSEFKRWVRADGDGLRFVLLVFENWR